MEKGSYYVGYEINRMKKMRLHFPPGNIIGGINCIFLKKSWHIYKCKWEIQGYAISRHSWNMIEEKQPMMSKEVKKKMLGFYLREVRTPLTKFKQKDLQLLENRADQSNILSIKDLGDEEVAEIMEQLWQPEENEENKAAIFKLNQHVNDMETQLTKLLGNLS